MTETWGIKGSSPAIRRLLRAIQVLAPLDATALITGETGTGKGLVARALHSASRRAREPFVHVDCAALAPSVIESELFGHERGAFTGAHRTQVGRFEGASAGTLFLDEIGEIDPALQAKLLRVLQDRVFERVGSAQTRRFRARVIAATHRNLEAAVAEESFRSDLYYRLNVVRLELPPLRERLEDLSELVSDRLGVAPSASLLAELRSHTWPGNVRELCNWLERRAVEEQLREVAFPVHVAEAMPRAFPVHVAEAMPRWSLGVCRGRVDQIDARLLAETLQDVGGNVSRAARRLGVARTTLRRRITRYGLAPMIPTD